MLSTKLKYHTVLPTEQDQTTVAGNIHRKYEVWTWFLRYESGQRDIQTNTNCNTLHPF